MIRRHDPALAALLEEAAREVGFPETPPLAGRVRARLESGPMPVAEIRLPRTRPPLLRPVLATLVVLAVLLAATLSVSVTARRAVADLLGVAGIRITFGDDPPATPRAPSRIGLGEPVSRAAASESAGFPVVVPRGVPGKPALYFEGSVGDSGMVSVVYPAGAETLADVDLLVSQFAAAVPAEYVKKLLTLGSEIEHTRIRSSDAFWISGLPHYFFYKEGDGTIQQETVRLAGNVLLWEENGVTYRVEGAASLAEARRIANSLR